MPSRTFTDSFLASEEITPREPQPTRVTFLSLVGIDPMLTAKATPEVTARRERMTRIVKGILGVAVFIGLLAVVRVACADALESDANASEVGSDENRIARTLEVSSGHGLARRSAIKSAPVATGLRRAQITHGWRR